MRPKLANQTIPPSRMLCVGGAFPSGGYFTRCDGLSVMGLGDSLPTLLIGWFQYWRQKKVVKPRCKIKRGEELRRRATPATGRHSQCLQWGVCYEAGYTLQRRIVASACHNPTPI